MTPCCRATSPSFAAFENAMTLDIAMGGSTNTVLHLLAAAHEGEVDFTMRDIDRLSRRVPVLCKVAPSVPDVHLEDVHRAGGIMAILGELDRAGLIDTERRTRAQRDARRCAGALGRRGTDSDGVQHFYRAAPGGVPTHGRLQPGPALRVARRRPRERRHPRRRARLSARTAGLPCSTATSPRMAAS